MQKVVLSDIMQFFFSNCLFLLDLCLPANSTAFVVAISERIAENQPNLTLEFLSECFIGFQKSSEPLRYLCLDYMVPWLPNLSRFCHSNIEDKETVKTKEVLRNLIDLTVARTEVSVSSFYGFIINRHVDVQAYTSKDMEDNWTD